MGDERSERVPDRGVFLTEDPGTEALDAAVVHESQAFPKRPRVGVDYAGHWARRHLRFYIAGNSFISRT